MANFFLNALVYLNEQNGKKMLLYVYGACSIYIIEI